MDAIIVYPENKEQLTAIKAVMKAMSISFEQRAVIYPEYVLSGIAKSLQEVEEGKLFPYTGIRDMLSESAEK